MNTIVLTEVFSTGYLWWKKKHKGELLLRVDKIQSVEEDGGGYAFVKYGEKEEVCVEETPKEVNDLIHRSLIGLR